MKYEKTETESQEILAGYLCLTENFVNWIESMGLAGHEGYVRGKVGRIVVRIFDPDNFKLGAVYKVSLKREFVDGRVRDRAWFWNYRQMMELDGRLEKIDWRLLLGARAVAWMLAALADIPYPKLPNPEESPKFVYSVLCKVPLGFWKALDRFAVDDFFDLSIPDEKDRKQASYRFTLSGSDLKIELTEDGLEHDFDVVIRSLVAHCPLGHDICLDELESFISASKRLEPSARQRDYTAVCKVPAGFWGALNGLRVQGCSGFHVPHVMAQGESVYKFTTSGPDLRIELAQEEPDEDFETLIRSLSSDSPIHRAIHAKGLKTFIKAAGGLEVSNGKEETEQGKTDNSC